MYKEYVKPEYRDLYDEFLKEDKNFRKVASEKSFLVFILYYFPNYVNYRLAEYHYAMEEDLFDLLKREKIREVLWVMYRESGKTTFLKLFIIWMIIFKKKHYINVDSFDKENAERILFDVVYELTNNKLLERDFGIFFSRKKENLDEIKKNTINNFVTQNGIRVEAHSTQESVRGRLHLNKRPDFLAIDDFETNKTKDSPAYTKSINQHITEAMGGMSPDGVILYLGNYLTEYGNIQYLLDRSKTDDKLRVRNVPVELDDGNLAWEDKFALTDEEAKRTGKVSIEDKIKQMGSQVFSYEMMNQPIDESIAEFKKEWWKHAEMHQVIGMRTNMFISIDSAVMKTDKADFTGISYCWVDTEGVWYVKTERKKINSTELMEQLFYMFDRFKPQIIGLEKMMATLTLGPILQKEMQKRNKYIPIQYIETSGTAKEVRIRGVIPRVENGGVFLIGENKELKDEARSFPRGKNDDVLDSFAQLEKIVYPPEKVTMATLHESLDYNVDDRSGYLR